MFLVSRSFLVPGLVLVVAIDRCLLVHDLAAYVVKQRCDYWRRSRACTWLNVLHVAPRSKLLNTRYKVPSMPQQAQPSLACRARCVPGAASPTITLL